MPPSLILLCGVVAIAAFSYFLYYIYPNVISEVAIPCAAGMAMAWWWMYEPSSLQKLSMPPSPQLSVSIKCSRESLPFRMVDSLYAIRLHPQWGNQLVEVKDETSWPDSATSTLSVIAYKCDVVNSGTVKVAGLIVPFRIIYRSQERKQPRRTIEIPFPDELELGNPLVLHIIDDSGWDPEVILPEYVSGHLPGERKTLSISVEHSTTSGEPMHLAGFGPH